MKALSALVLAALAVVASQNSFAAESIKGIETLAHAMATVAPYDMINWKVGESASYDVGIGSFGKLGSMNKSVTKEEGGAIWIHTEVNLVIQNDTTDMLINRADGKVLKVIHNGKEEPMNDDDKPEIISQDYAEVTVPAGTFKTIHVTGKTKKVEKFEIWANPRDTVMEGTIKMLISGQMEMTSELNNFKRVQ